MSWQDAQYDAYHWCCHQGIKPTRWSVIWRAVGYLLIQPICALRFKLCSWRGHKLVDEGWAGPDSGTIYLVCERCGWSYEHILY